MVNLCNELSFAGSTRCREKNVNIPGEEGIAAPAGAAQSQDDRRTSLVVTACSRA